MRSSTAVDGPRRRELIQLLRSTDVFGLIDRQVLDQIVSSSHLVHLAGGETLLCEGDPGDAMYIVVAGRLRAARRGDDGDEIELQELGPGQPVGEIALLVDQPRGATVRAIRDTQLLRVAADDVSSLIRTHPTLGLSLARVIVRRSTSPGRARQDSVVRTIAVVPAGATATVSEFCRLLTATLRTRGQVAHVSAEVAEAALGVRRLRNGLTGERGEQVRRWLAEAEGHATTVVLEASRSRVGWSALCVRHADLVLLVADSSVDASSSILERRVAGELAHSSRPRVELVIQHPVGTTQPTETAKWLGPRAVDAHHHVLAGRQPDVERVVRLATGVGTGLVLGGGGPRGFAHLGVVAALEDAGVPIDAIGGSSIGAVIGGFVAAGWDQPLRLAKAVEGFVNTKRLIGATLPLLSLSSSRTITALLRDERFFGTMRLEDLWRPYFCVSTNLSRGEVVVHDKGPVWEAVRASIAIPGVLPPVVRDGDLLVDGAVLNNLPVDVMRQRIRGGKLLAVDLQPAVDTQPHEPFDPTVSGWRLLGRKIGRHADIGAVPSLMEVVLRSKDVAGRRAQHALINAADVDLVLRPPTAGFPALDFRAATSLIDVGYRYASELLEREGVDHLVHHRQYPRSGDRGAA